MATDFGIAREIMYYVQAYSEESPSDSYSKHHFIAAPFDKVEIKAYILNPFKWFFSHFVETTSERRNVTQRAFEKLSVVINVLDTETDQFKDFEEKLKERAGKYPWFSRAYQGCLEVGGTCIFDRSTAKVSDGYRMSKLNFHMVLTAVNVLGDQCNEMLRFCDSTKTIF